MDAHIRVLHSLDRTAAGSRRHRSLANRREQPSRLGFAFFLWGLSDPEKAAASRYRSRAVANFAPKNRCSMGLRASTRAA